MTLKKLTPIDERATDSQSLSAPIHLKEDILVELTLLHQSEIIITLPFNRFASPLFAQREPNGKLRLLVELIKIKHLSSDNYINNNNPVSGLLHAVQHMTGKTLLYKLDCSQAYHCLQMAK